jgi:hypothetical protein
MQRSDIFLLLAGAGGIIAVLLLYGFVRALILRRRRKRKAAQAWRVPMPQAEHPAIEEIRREADASHRRSGQRNRLEAEWHQDGEIELRPKKPPEETP